MKIAFIVQRYGTEILGGSEYHCRLIAERLARGHDVDVLTTCARDYITWKNEYPEGADRVRGVTVRRFASTETRDIVEFNRYSDWIFNYPHSSDDEREWLRRQGPWSPALFEFIETRHRDYDALVFFTYLYAPTVIGLQAAPAKSLLVPTAHDEPAIRLGIYRDVFSSPAAIAFNTEVERRFLAATFDIRAGTQETVGCGVDYPMDNAGAEPVADGEGAQAVSAGQGRDDGRSRPGREQGRQPRGGQATAVAGDARSAREDRQRFERLPRGAMFRRRHRLYGPMVLYGGRIDPGKGCEELFEYFSSYVDGGGDAMLALMGVKLMPIPETKWVRFAGTLPEQERLEALEAATIVAVPSPYESLSLLALESFAVGTPILANARSEVLVEHCRASRAGLFYENRDEFVEGLNLLLADGQLRRTMGRNGRDYVRNNYSWDVILAKYDRLLGGLRPSTSSGRP